MPGVPLGAPPKSSESRRTVTVVFSDVASSTALGESLDPEALRAIMARYFDAMQGVVESYGGVVEKFIGDAVMAVFGIPQLHEDDALRAVRAADAMRERLGVLNDELERGHGVRLEARIGVNTGEVVAGDPAGGQRLVTGDPVNVAARLEQAAGPGEILIGARTHRLVHEAIRVPPPSAWSLRGKLSRSPRSGCSRSSPARRPSRAASMRPLSAASESSSFCGPSSRAAPRGANAAW